MRLAKGVTQIDLELHHTENGRKEDTRRRSTPPIPIPQRQTNGNGASGGSGSSQRRRSLSVGGSPITTSRDTPGSEPGPAGFGANRNRGRGPRMGLPRAPLAPAPAQAPTSGAAPEGAPELKAMQVDAGAVEDCKPFYLSVGGAAVVLDVHSGANGSAVKDQGPLCAGMGMLSDRDHDHDRQSPSPTGSQLDLTLHGMDVHGGFGLSGVNEGRWTDEEHTAFLDGVARYGRSWKDIAILVRTRTTEQIRTHAQKYFQRNPDSRRGSIDETSTRFSEASMGSQ
jgi:SHAQKYF class myb-like DNA-binding protein